MGRKSKHDKDFEESFIEDIVNIIRLTTSSNDEVKDKYKLFIKNETLTPFQKKYFKKLVFDKIDYTETRKKMQRLLEKDINIVTFSGKELKNIQRFLREQKLKKLELN